MVKPQDRGQIRCPRHHLLPYPGTWSSRVRISTFDAKAGPDAVIATPAIEAPNPLVAVSATGTGKTLPAEQSGTSGDITVTLPAKFTTATPFKLRGEIDWQALANHQRKTQHPAPRLRPGKFPLEKLKEQTMKLLLTPSILLTSQLALFAATEVKTEQVNPASPDWKFTRILGPSASDIAQEGRISVVSGHLYGGDATAPALINGRLPDNAATLNQCVLFDTGGILLLDLGRLQPVSAINTFSWHEFPNDQGARGPQVYTLYASAKTVADPANPADWTKIAAVDTRPNQTGDKWNGQHGVNIIDTTGSLGEFRYLKFDVKPTGSPKQPNMAFTSTLFSEIDVHSPSTLVASQPASVAKPVKVDQIWLVYKSHFDIGYNNTVAGILKKYRTTMVDEAMANIEKDRALPPEQRFKWTVPGWPLEYMSNEGQTPERRSKLLAAVKDGSIAVHALPFTTHTESLELEDLVRGLHYSSQLMRAAGRPLPTAAKMTDVPSHSWVLPTLLAHAGVKFLHIGDNPASQYPRLPELFWWEGPDGSRILCGYTATYGSGLFPGKNWPAKNYLAMITAGDNHGPPSQAEVASHRKAIATQMPNTKVTLATLDDFAAAIEKEKPDLPVVRGDMPDTWIHGLMSNPVESHRARVLRPLIPTLDTLDTQLRAWGVAPSPLDKPIAAAYENSLLYGEHTWGFYFEAVGGHFGENWKKKIAEGYYQNRPGHFLNGDKEDKSKPFDWLKTFEDKKDYLRKTDKIVTAELDSRLRLLAQNVKAPAGSTIVYNPLPWVRSGLVEVAGKQIFAKDVPACGYLTLKDPSDPTNPPDPSDLSNTTLSTPHFTVTFDLKRGGISSLIEKSSGRELVDPSSPYAVGQFIHERFSQNEVNAFLKVYLTSHADWALNQIGKPGMPDPKQCPYAVISPDQWKLFISHSNTADVATLTAGDTKGLAKGYTLSFTFPKHSPQIETAWTVKDKTPDPIPEGGWLAFPFAVDQPQFTVGRPGGPINPAKDIVSGSNRYLMAVATGVAMNHAEHHGVTVCPIDSPLVSLDHPGLWQWSLEFTPTKPSVFVNLYNNMWNTNFMLWQDGSWTSRVRFWPTGKNTHAPTDLAVNGWDARVPLLAVPATGSGKTLPAEQSGISVSRKGVLVTAFGQNPDGEGTLLRIWEQAGSSGDLTVTLPSGAKFATATPVNLRGESAGESIAIKDGKLTFAFKAYAPASFILQ